MNSARLLLPLLLLSAGLASAQLQITTSTLPNGSVGVPYSASLEASGGTKPYRWSIASGSLPAGLTLHPNNGDISGTPTTAGISSFTVRVMDNSNATATRALTITIAAGPPTITTASPLPDGTVGAAYSQTLAATGGVPPYTWSISSGSLPAGLSLSATTGEIAGTPTVAGTVAFTVRVTDVTLATSTKAFAVTIVTPPPVITTTSLPGGSVGVAYPSTTLTASGGTPPLTWSLAGGSLPPGLSLSTAGIISGTPTAAGAFPFTVRVTDGANRTAQRDLSITISAGLAITACPSAQGIVGQPYAFTFAATGGSTPYTWSVSAGSLPPGIVLDAASGALSGSPTTAGTSSFTIRVTDSAAAFATRACQIVVVAALTITTTTLPDGVVSVAYSQDLLASGGVTPYTWTVVSGSLPAGLTLSASGRISGTPTAAGASTFRVQVRDTNGATAERDLTINITSGLTVTACPANNGVVGQSYSFTFAATGGTPPYSWAVSAGSLPAGLILDAAGAVSGTPSQAGTSQFTVRVTDNTTASATRQCQIVVDAALSVATTALPDAIVSVAYAQDLAGSGGSGPYTWSLAGGSLPAGLTLASTGRISGTPTAAGVSTFRVQVRDRNNATAERDLSITVTAGLGVSACPAVAAVVGQPYSSAAAATGGRPPYSWSISAGRLPAGLALAASGSVSGTATETGSFPFTLSVTDSTGASSARTCTITVTAGLTITTSALPNATVRTAYSQSLAAAGGTPPYSWTTSAGSLPPGLLLTASGQVTGTPTVTGSFQFAARVTDAAGAQAERGLTILVVASLSIADCPAPVGTVGRSYSSAAAAVGGEPPLSWSLSAGALPQGLALNSTNGAVTGTPTQAGTASFTVRAVDRAGSAASRACSIAIGDALSITTNAVPDAVAGSAYSATLAAAGGSQPYTWSLVSGVLPPGLSLTSATGGIAGTPVQAGSFGFTARVSDAAGLTADREFTIRVETGFSITSCPAAAATVGEAYSSSFAAAGGQLPLVWVIAGGGLPPGLSMDAGAGAITGTPSASGSFALTVRATDRAGTAATRACTIVVAPPPLVITSVQPADAVIGTAYSHILSAAGGTGPYTWSLDAGRLPDGVSLSTAGQLTGTPRAAGAFPFTARVTDQGRASVVRAFTLNVLAASLPEVILDGLPDLAAPADQHAVTIKLGAGYPAQLSGRLLLSFIPDAGAAVDDPSIQFASGGRSAAFTIPANQTTAEFTVPVQAVQTGTVAGTIELRVEMSAAGANLAADTLPRKSIRIDRLPPRITDVRLVAIPGGLEVWVTGFATTREVAVGSFRFIPRNPARAQPADVTVPLGDASRTWFQDARSVQFGSQFTLVQPFSFPGGVEEVGEVSVSLGNGQGTGNTIVRTR